MPELVMRISVSFMISLLVSLIPLGVPFLFASNSSTLKRRVIPSLLLVPIIILFFIAVKFFPISVFFSKMEFLLCSRFISSLLVKMGCSGTLALVIGCALRVLFITEATPPLGNLVLPEGTSGASSSELTLEEAVKMEKEAIRTLVIDNVLCYVHLFEKEIKAEFPKAEMEIGTNLFLNNLVKEVISDFGFEDPSPSSLTSLKKFRRTISESFSFLNEQSPCYKNNILYDNMRILLRDHR